MTNRAPRFTLDGILARRDEALADVRNSGRRMRTLAQSLFEPPKATGRFGGLMNNFDRVMAVYDGVMLGMKIIGRVRRLVRRR